MWRVNAVIPDNRSLDMLGEKQQITMQVFCKRMGSIHNEADIMLLTTGNHLRHFHTSRQMNTMYKVDFLPIAASRIIIGGASLFQYLYGLTALRRSSEYQYHRL